EGTPEPCKQSYGQQSLVNTSGVMASEMAASSPADTISKNERRSADGGRRRTDRRGTLRRLVLAGPGGGLPWHVRHLHSFPVSGLFRAAFSLSHRFLRVRGCGRKEL